jgi:hypothetical protein
VGEVGVNNGPGDKSRANEGAEAKSGEVIVYVIACWLVVLLLVYSCSFIIHQHLNPSVQQDPSVEYLAYTFDKTDDDVRVDETDCRRRLAGRRGRIGSSDQ